MTADSKFWDFVSKPGFGIVMTSMNYFVFNLCHLKIISLDNHALQLWHVRRPWRGNYLVRFIGSKVEYKKTRDVSAEALPI